MVAGPRDGALARAELPRGREVRLEVETATPFRLPRRGGLDGLVRVRGGVVHRLLHRGDEPVIVRVAQLGPRRVLFGARAADPRDAEWGISRMRVALGVDHDLREFHARFRYDPLIGQAVRADPGLRVRGRPRPFEALVWAICEQLITFERAAAIQRSLVFALGRGCAASGLRDSPDARTLAAQAPAALERCGLSGGRALALRRAADEVASGRVDLEATDVEAGWRRLRRIRGIGTWTIAKLGLEGQGRLDQLPAGDLAYLKLVGRLLTGNPWARASEDEVAAFFAPYAPYAGLAGAYALRVGGRPGLRAALAAA